MVAERAGYTVTMFIIDLSPSMGNKRIVEVPDSKGGETVQIETTNLEWAVQFVKLKIQEMIFNGRKTDQCGVIAFGTPETNNVLNDRGQGYDNIYEYIPINTPNASTLTKLDDLCATSVCGDPIDAIIVGIETQQLHLATKRTWTRKMVLVTDGESPIELDEWESTADALNEREVTLTVVGVDFDDENLPYKEEDKSDIKTKNEEFYHEFVGKLNSGVIGTCAYALEDVARPELKTIKSVLMGTVLRVGDVEARPDEAMEILVKTSKCTALARPKSWKRFMKREKPADGEAMDVDGEEASTFAELKLRSEYYLEKAADEDEIKQEDDDEGRQDQQRIDKEELVRGFKYGATYVSCPDGQFERLKTRKGIDICGFFKKKMFRRELAMGEVQYIWADPGSPNQQIALSSIAQGMQAAKVMGIARWVTKDGMDPKMGVVLPCIFDKVDCLLWVQMPFADDVRKYTFPALEKLVNKEGERVTEHPYLPTDAQLAAMGKLVDAMDLMESGEKDEESGERLPWYDNRLSYNPAVHRIKQAMFHSAVVTDLASNPLPPPHPEVIKYFDPPKRVLKRVMEPLDECTRAFKVKKVPKKVAKARKDEHAHAEITTEQDMMLLDKVGPKQPRPERAAQAQTQTQKTQVIATEGSDTEDEEEMVIDEAVGKNPESPKRGPGLPTPARSLSPQQSMPQMDPERAPGRIIGNAFPLRDFRENIAEGDVVSKAVEDLTFVILDVVKKPFARRRHVEMIDCMKELRTVCLKEDEINAWNDFLTDLRDECRDEKLNVEFWEEVKKEGRPISLISKPEAKENGGRSSMSESMALEFIG